MITDPASADSGQPDAGSANPASSGAADAGPVPPNPGSGAADAGASLADSDPPHPAYPDTGQPDPEPEDHVTTGHAEIDTALRRLDELDGLPVEQHGEIYDELHGRLRDALTAAATPTSESSDA